MTRESFDFPWVLVFREERWQRLGQTANVLVPYGDRGQKSSYSPRYPHSMWLTQFNYTVHRPFK